MHKQKIKAFTLVELIVVIAILAILGTIAFVSLQGYSTNARDSTRISDISSLKTSLELFQLEAGKYPNPTSGVDITYSGAVVWTQGIFGETVYTNTDKLDKIPIDPLTNSSYTYSVTQNKNEYQLGGILEGDTIVMNNEQGTINNFGIQNTNAGATEAIAYITGNYNGEITKSLSGVICNVFSVPTIIASDIEISTDLEEISSQKRFVYSGYKNLPNSFRTSKFNVDGGFDYKVNKLVAYTDTGSCIDLIDKNNSSARVSLLKGIQDSYSGTTLKDKGEIKNLLALNIDTNNPSNEVIKYAGNFVNNNLGGNIFVDGNSGGNTGNTSNVTTSLITESDCTTAGWIWVDSLTDVNIGSSKGNGFCISPMYGDWNDGYAGDAALSWNGWGHLGLSYYEGWNPNVPTSIDDTGNGVPDYGQTRILDSKDSYNCKSLGTATSDFVTSDTLVGRMKWLATTGNSYIEARSIDWITGLIPHTLGTNPQAIPALYIADCIDGVKDLGTTMNYKHIDNGVEEITYNEYTSDVIVSQTSPSLSDNTYQNRQKYLTAWTQKPGSHLPSAFSYITSGYSSAADSDGNILQGIDRGEYQVACDAGKFGNVGQYGSNPVDYIGGLEQQLVEYSYLAAIGRINGGEWGNSARVIGLSTCGTQYHVYTSNREYNLSTRFVVRP